MAIKDNLVSYWKLQGNSNDSIASNNGTDTSITYGTSYGKIDQGANFGGSSLISVANDANLGSFTALTINFWVYRTGTSDQMGLVVKNRASNDEQWFLNNFNSTNHYPYFQIQDNTGTNHYYIGSTSITANAWCMVTGVWTGSVMKTYINGTQTGKSASSNDTVGFTIATNGTSNNDLRFGAFRTSRLTGNMDEIGVWSRALSDAEITSLYNSGNGDNSFLGIAYTLSLAYNAFVLTGYASTLTKALKMLLGYNSFSSTGIAVTLKRALQMLINYGTYALTGFDVGLSNLKQILIDVGNFALTGYDATLRVCRCLTADVGNFILTGVNVILKSTAWGNDSKPSASIWTEDTKPSNSWTNDTK